MKRPSFGASQLQSFKDMKSTAAEGMNFNVGDVVYVTKGAFSNFSGAVERVQLDLGTVRIAIPMFEKSTTVELELGDVERI